MFCSLHLVLWSNGYYGIHDVWSRGEFSSDIESPSRKIELKDCNLHHSDQSTDKVCVASDTYRKFHRGTVSTLKATVH